MQFSPLNKITSLTVSIFLLLSAGCATTAFHGTLLDFLEDGKTPRETVIVRLGPPSGTFEGERIISYWLFGDRSGKYFITDKRSGFEGTFSLVLVFDENNVLQKHSVVKVQ